MFGRRDEHRPGYAHPQPAGPTSSIDAPTLTEELGSTSSGQQLLELAGAPMCGVDFYYIEYWTVGAKGESATATGALMLPTGLFVNAFSVNIPSSQRLSRRLQSLVC